MLYASRLAERLGFIDSSVTSRQEALLSLCGLPTRLPADWAHAEDAVIDRMKLDKIQQYCFRHQLSNPNPITLTLTLYSP